MRLHGNPVAATDLTVWVARRTYLHSSGNVGPPCTLGDPRSPFLLPVPWASKQGTESRGHTLILQKTRSFKTITTSARHCVDHCEGWRGFMRDVKMGAAVRTSSMEKRQPAAGKAVWGREVARSRLAAGWPCAVRAHALAHRHAHAYLLHLAVSRARFTVRSNNTKNPTQCPLCSEASTDVSK